MLAWQLLGAAAPAATLTVGPGQAYATIQAAVTAAASGDTVEVHAGTYTENVVATVPLHFVGVGRPVVRPRAVGFFDVALEAQAAGSVTGLTFVGRGVRCLLVWNPAPFGQPFDYAVTDARFTGCDLGVDAQDVVVVVDRSVFADNVTGVSATALSGRSTQAISRSLFLRNTIGATLSSDAEVTTSGFVANAIGLDLGDLDTQRVARNVFCGNREGALVGFSSTFYVQPNEVTRVEGNLFQENRGGPRTGAAIDVASGGYGGRVFLEVVGNTFVGNDGGGAAHVRVDDAHVTFESDLFGLGGSRAPAIWAPNNQVDGDWNLFWSNAGGDFNGAHTQADLGASTLWATDPMWTSYLQNGDCRDDDLAPLPGSPIVDAGDPSTNDPDGTRSDIGWVYYP